MLVENTSIIVEICFLQSGGVGAAFYYAFTVCVTAPFLVCGLIGNSVALVVFRAEWRQAHRGATSMTVLLIALSCGNLSMVAFALVTFLPSEIYCFAQAKSLEPYILELVNVNSMIYATDDAIHMFLIYTILAVAVERWLAAYFPIQRRSSMFTFRKIGRYLAAVAIFSILFQIPRLLEHRLQNVIEVIQNPHTAASFGTGSGVLMPDLNKTSLADISQELESGAMRDILDKEMQFSVETVTQAVQNPFHVIYRLSHTLMEQIIPMLVATVVHVCLMMSLKKAKRCRTFLIRLNSGNTESLKVSRRQSLSRIDRSAHLAFITVSVFIICEMPLCVNKFMEVALYLRGPQDLQESTTIGMTAFHGVAHSIIHLQASLNLILYCWTSTKFRMSLRQVCSGRRENNVFVAPQQEDVVAYVNQQQQYSPSSLRRAEKIVVSRRISNQLSNNSALTNLLP